MKKKKIKLIPIKDEKEINTPSLPDIQIPFGEKEKNNIPDCCRLCPNRGSNFCNCALPYFDRKWWIT